MYEFIIVKHLTITCRMIRDYDSFEEPFRM